MTDLRRLSERANSTCLATTIRSAMRSIWRGSPPHTGNSSCGSVKKPPGSQIERSEKRRKWIADDDAGILVERVHHLPIAGDDAGDDADVRGGIVLSYLASSQGVIEGQFARLERKGYA
jgi:hypothetical protein